MTKYDVIRMAREAGLGTALCHNSIDGDRIWIEGADWHDEIERFAALVAAAERNRTWTQAHWTEYERSIVAAERARMIADGWRQCAQGQRTTQFCGMAEQAFQEAQECAAAEREDAERYRWLRDNNARFSWNPSKYNQEKISGFAAFGTGYCGFEFENAIDKAMGEK